MALVLIGLALLALGAFALFGGDDDSGGNGGTEPSGGPLAGNYEVEGTNSDGSAYRGTAVITGQRPRLPGRLDQWLLDLVGSGHPRG